MAPETRPFRFGLIVDSREATRRSVIELARRAEGLGISILLGTDHLGRWATLPLLQVAAQATTLRIGSLVLNNDLRHPAVLAQELATMDLVTDGRLEIGLGAGWNRREYESAGMSFDPAPMRVARMEASVRILKQALSEGRIEREADDAYPAMHMAGVPRSVQRPHPPILVGGGRRRLLSFAAREADIVAIDPRSMPGGGHDDGDVTEADVDRKIGWIREAAGERWTQLEINVVLLDVGPAVDPALHGSPHYLAGESDEMVERLLARRERWGITYICMRPKQLDAMEPLVRKLA